MKFLNNKKEPTELDRVMENITRIEAEMNQKIFQLGQMYYEDNKNKANGDVEDKYFAIIDSVNKMGQNRIGFYKNKLRLEGMMMCENCGATIPYGSIYCNICGSKADEKQGGETVNAVPAGQEVLKCKNCGAVLEAGSLFCVSCGTKVE